MTGDFDESCMFDCVVFVMLESKISVIFVVWRFQRELFCENVIQNTFYKGFSWRCE